MEALRVFISYSHDSREHSQQVLELSNRLRTDGIDCSIDQYEVSPPEGWPHWMDRQIAAADFVLVVCTGTYLRRLDGRERPGLGLGVRWESVLIYQHLYDAGANNTKFVPVIFRASDAQHIPTPLKGATRVCLEHPAGYDDLRGRIHNIPNAVKPPVARALGARESEQSFFKAPPNNFLAAGVAPNIDFVGREGLLRDLHERLRSGHVALQHVLTGEGGVGKTQLAIEYAHRHAGDYDGLWWLDASDEAIETATEGLTTSLGLSFPRGTPPDEIRLALREHLSGARHLLILDNLEKPDLLRKFLLQSPARLLVTTRRTDLPAGIAVALEVDVLTLTEAVALLRKHRPDLANASHDRPLAAIVDCLGCHSLAVALAGTYLGRCKNVTPEEASLNGSDAPRLATRTIYSKG